jgi:hypothetical protein
MLTRISLRVFSRWIIVLLACCFQATLLSAANNFFLPGDAFFHVCVDKDLAEKLSDEVNVNSAFKFQYCISGTYTLAFSGYAGYEFATLSNMNASFARNISETYRLVRHFDQRELREWRSESGEVLQLETNGAHMFFVRSDFDFNKFAIGLKYNEHWTVEAGKFGGVSQLCCFVQTVQAIEQSWRDSTAVKALPASLPSDLPKRGVAIPTPIELEGEVHALIIPKWNLERYFAREESLPLYRVTPSGISEFRIENGKWTLSEED